jgi:hypothetical protein
VPPWQDVGDRSENISNDDPNNLSTPNITQTSAEVAVRLSRNASWPAIAHGNLGHEPEAKPVARSCQSLGPTAANGAARGQRVRSALP